MRLGQFRKGREKEKKMKRIGVFRQLLIPIVSPSPKLARPLLLARQALEPMTDDASTARTKSTTYL
jgi:hypothetical protein